MGCIGNLDPGCESRVDAERRFGIEENSQWQERVLGFSVEPGKTTPSLFFDPKELAKRCEDGKMPLKNVLRTGVLKPLSRFVIRKSAVQC